MFTGPVQISSQEVFKTSPVKLFPLGTAGVTKDGRVFRYTLAGAVALAPGKLNQTAAVVANHQNILVAVAPAVSDLAISLTLGASPTTVAQYDDGFVVGYDVAGQGQTLRISGTPVLAANATGQFLLGDPIIQPLTTASRVNLEQNPWSNNIVAPSTSTGDFITGVAPTTVPAGQYAWLQTRGTAAVLGNGAIAKGTGVVSSATTAGAVDAEAATTVLQRVGLAVQTGTSTKYNTTYLTID